LNLPFGLAAPRKTKTLDMALAQTLPATTTVSVQFKSSEPIFGAIT
jgi:hypothetical protein